MPARRNDALTCAKHGTSHTPTKRCEACLEEEHQERLWQGMQSRRYPEPLSAPPEGMRYEWTHVGDSYVPFAVPEKPDAGKYNERDVMLQAMTLGLPGRRDRRKPKLGRGPGGGNNTSPRPGRG